MFNKLNTRPISKLAGKIKCKKGMTLVEMLVAIAISAIVMSGILTIVVPTSKQLLYTSDLAHAKNMTSQIVLVLKNKIQYASTIKIYDDGGTTYIPGDLDNTVIYSAPDNPSSPTYDPKLIKIMCQDKGEAIGNDFVSDVLYDNLNFIITYSTSEVADVLNVHFTVLKKANDEQVYTTTVPIKILNVSIKSGQIVNSGTSDGNYIDVTF